MKLLKQIQQEKLSNVGLKPKCKFKLGLVTPKTMTYSDRIEQFCDSILSQNNEIVGPVDPTIHRTQKSVISQTTTGDIDANDT